MAVTLSSQEVAALTGKTERTVRRWAESGKIPAERVLNKFNSPEYLFNLDALEPHLQQKYFDGLKLTPSPEVAQTLTKEAKPLDTYSIEEQEEIAFWLRLVKQWQGYRNKPGANKTEVDANFVQWCKLEYPERAISVDTLYRRWNAVRDNDLDGLIDKRGKWKKGKSSIPDPMWQAFLYFYLDERQHPLKKCYEYTKLEMQTSFPELVGDMPSYTTFYRRAQADIPEPLKVLGREGEKAFRDRCAPYIRRVYDDMRSNEWWIADNHTFDIITEGENGQRHRLYLTAFFDARSGIFKIDALDPALRETVEQMLLSGSTYSEIVDFLGANGVGISVASVCRYARAYQAEVQMLNMAQENFRRMMDELDKYPDLDTTEAIIRLTSQNLLNALANTSEEDWQGVSIDKMLREANALVRAAAYKKRVEIQNQDTTEAGLDAVKSLVWQAMAKERPDLYRQVNEFLNSKRQDGLEAR